jgi:rod shape-determining protein MreC
MQQIVNFIFKNSYKMLFLLLLGISLFLTFQSHAYHRSQYINSSNSVVGYTYSKINTVKEYFGLRQKNEDISKENARLKEILFNKKDTVLSKDFKVPSGLKDFVVYQAKVIKNSYDKQDNYLTINRGRLHGIRPEMAVISDRGVIGTIEKVSDNYATIISVLHSATSLNGKLKNDNNFGSIKWDGKNVGFVQLVDLPKLATIKKGDTIVTGEQTTIFPKDIPFGKIDKIFVEKNSNKFVINIRLFNDMTNLGYVYIIDNKKRVERQKLEEETEKTKTKQ